MPSTIGRAVRIIDSCPETDWRGHVWRAHKYGPHKGAPRIARDFAYTERTVGRWHLGLDYEEEDRFPALYTSIHAHVAEAEFLRHLDARNRPSGHIDLRRDRFRLSQLVVKLSRVIDLCDLRAIDVTCDEVCNDSDYSFP